MHEKLFEEIRKLIQEVEETSPRTLVEQSLPVAARQLQELADRIVRSWNRAYAEFVEARALAYDIAETFGLPTRVSRGTKEVRNITQDSEESLVSTINWVAERFRKDYQNTVMKRGGDIREAARRVKEAAERAEGTADAELKEAAKAFLKSFLPYRTAISDQVFREVSAILRRTEEMTNRFLPEGQRPGHPPAGKRGALHKGSVLKTSLDVADTAGQIIERLDTFAHLSGPTIDEIEKIGDLAVEVSADFPLPPAAPEKGAKKEEATPEEVSRRKRITDWLPVVWEDDSEIGVFI